MATKPVRRTMAEMKDAFRSCKIHLIHRRSGDLYLLQKLGKSGEDIITNGPRFSRKILKNFLLDPVAGDLLLESPDKTMSVIRLTTKTQENADAL